MLDAQHLTGHTIPCSRATECRSGRRAALFGHAASCNTDSLTHYGCLVFPCLHLATPFTCIPPISSWYPSTVLHPPRRLISCLGMLPAVILTHSHITTVLSFLAFTSPRRLLAFHQFQAGIQAQFFIHHVALYRVWACCQLSQWRCPGRICGARRSAGQRAGVRRNVRDCVTAASIRPHRGLYFPPLYTRLHQAQRRRSWSTRGRFCSARDQYMRMRNPPVPVLPCQTVTKHVILRIHPAFFRDYLHNGSQKLFTAPMPEKAEVRQNERDLRPSLSAGPRPRRRKRSNNACAVQCNGDITVPAQRRQSDHLQP
ncbi:hypothetical protein J6590_041816 [Homalodisca vitripennis]|nr:hypothetical protein J6590_041816 [Homalodisca vitripennis]